MSKANIKFSGFTLAKGKELKGDDYYIVKTIGNLTVAIVCDGVGSAMQGALAAKRVSNYLITNFKNRPITWSIEKSIKSFITSINSILFQESMTNYESPELVTTLCIVVIEGNRLYGANVGDSRVYLNRDDSLTQLSNDHAMSEEGFENVLTQAIGIQKDLDIYYFENILQKNDKLLICSDGLYTLFNDDILKKSLNIGANALVKKASFSVKDELPDDTTAVIIEIIEENQVQILKNLELEIPQSLVKGQDIDGYILKKSLIQNNRTWLCNKKGKNYVLKFAPLEAIDDEIALDLYVKEAWNSKRLKAGFFPKAVIPKNRTKRYYVMEAINGVNLKTYLKKRKLYVDDAILLVKTLLNMAQYLLKYDLVHADIKPENIMIIKRDDKHIFKIIDFGSMCEIYSLDSKAGTPSYLAPQRFENESINESSEIFSIGVTLYESLTSKFPYGEIEPFTNPEFKLKNMPKDLNNNIPLWLESVILRAISVDSNLRYNHYSEMLFELEHSNKVKPFYDKSKPLIQTNPLFVYKSSFYFMIFLNMILIVMLLK